jgi:hypothetical protein
MFAFGLDWVTTTGPWLRVTMLLLAASRRQIPTSANIADAIAAKAAARSTLNRL